MIYSHYKQRENLQVQCIVKVSLYARPIRSTHKFVVKNKKHSSGIEYNILKSCRATYIHYIQVYRKYSIDKVILMNDFSTSHISYD